MNSLIVILFCLIKNVSMVEGKQSTAKEAINSLLKHNANSGTSKVDFIFFEESKDLMQEVLKVPLDFSATKTVFNGTDLSWNNRLNESSVLVFESVDVFIQNAGNIKWLSNPSLRHQHIVYCPGLTTDNIVENIPDGFEIDKVAFLMNETQTSIDLVSSFMFTPQKCRENQLVTVNRFNGKTLEWESDEFYPRKYGNLHSCNLTVCVPKPVTNFKITPLLANLFNFEANYVSKSLLKKTDLVEDFVYSSALGSGTMFSSPVFFSTYVVVAPLNGEPKTQFEKMFLMFDLEVWMAIAGVILFYAISIQVIKCCPIAVQNYIFGRNVRSPIMNLTDIFLNGGQCLVPGRNFARFMLVMVIFWSLIIRTCYQSMLFEYLQSDKRKTYTLTYDDLLEDDCKFEFIGQFDGIFCRLSECLNIVADYSNMKVSVAEEGFLDVIEAHRFSSGFASLRTLSEKVSIQYWFPYFASFNPFFEEFNAKISQMVATGHFGSWKMHEIKKSLIKDRKDNIGPQVLTMEQLEVAFIVCSVPAILSVVVFCFEVLVQSPRVQRGLTALCRIFQK